MTNSDAIREFAEKWGFSQDKTNEGFLIDNDRTKQCLSDLTALISEHYYPKEFVEWYVAEVSNDRARIYPYCYMIWVDGTGIGFDTFDELFNYWEENER